MLKVFPHNGLELAEFDKVLQMLKHLCEGKWAKNRIDHLKINTQKSIIQRDLDQTYEFYLMLNQGYAYPNIFSADLKKLLKNIEIVNYAIEIQEVIEIRTLVLYTQKLKSWFDTKKEIYPILNDLFSELEIAVEILDEINQLIDDKNQIKDDASKDLLKIRNELKEMRLEHQRVFQRLIRRYKKDGKLADTQEAFLHNKKVLAVLAEYKRQIPGITHGESESSKTVYIEPEATIDLNNRIQNLEYKEQNEILKLLRNLSEFLNNYLAQLKQYQIINGLMDFTRAKAKLASKMNASKPSITDHPHVVLKKAHHPLLFLYNQDGAKDTVPCDIEINNQHQIIVISGPNAGGKTVAMKTVALFQMMFQAGLLLPCESTSQIGIFNQLFVQIGDTQSLEHELSTYSSHLKNMKYFVERATKRTLFFIDELGSGSDPHLGGVFAEVILEELVKTGAKGIVTTHYLNLKTLADRIPTMINAAMLFDENSLSPLYILETGKPGSSYTFAIAQRTGIPKHIIERATKLVKEEHLHLEKLLRENEKRFLNLQKQEKELQKQLTASKIQETKYKELVEDETQKRREKQQELQNKIKQEEINYLKEVERKFKQIVQDWKKSENKLDVIKAAENLLFNRKIISSNQKLSNKVDKTYKIIKVKLEIGTLVRNMENDQVGHILELDNKDAKVKIGNLAFTMNISKLVPVEKKEDKKKKS